MRLWGTSQTRQAQPLTAQESQIVSVMQWTERVLAYTAAEAGLDCRCEQSVMGPHTFSYFVRLLNGKPSTLDGLAPAIRANLLAVPGSPSLAGEVRVSRDGSVGWRIEVPSPFPVTPSPAQLARATSGLRVAVALDHQFRPVLVDLAANPALMWVGPTGRGKTEAARSALYALVTRNSLADLTLVVLAEKRYRWQDFTATPHCLAAAHTPDDIARLLARIVAKMEARLRDGAHRPAILSIVDDGHNLFAGPQGRAIAHSLARLSSIGREAGMLTWLLTQDAGSKDASGSQLFEANARVKVMFRATNKQASARAAGMGGSGLEALSNHPGDCLVDLDGKSIRAATAYDARLSEKLPQVAPTPATPLTPVSAPVFDPPRTPPAAANGGGQTPVSTPPPTPALAWPINAARPLSAEETAEARRLYDNGRGLSLNKLCEKVYGPKNPSKMWYLRDALGVPQPRIAGGDE